MKLFKYSVAARPKGSRGVNSYMHGFTLADSLNDARKNVEEHYPEDEIKKYEVRHIEEANVYECKYQT